MTSTTTETTTTSTTTTTTEEEFKCFQCWQKSGEENLNCWDLNREESNQTACTTHKKCITTKIGIKTKLIN